MKYEYIDIRPVRKVKGKKAENTSVSPDEDL